MEWKVSKERVQIKPHPNADKLCLIKVGQYQAVSSLDNGYVEGQEVIVMPEKTVIHHEEMRLEEEKYLTGAKRNRVKTVELRGEISQCATYPVNKLRELYDDRTVDLVESAECGVDLSELLGMSKYIVPIPVELAGQVGRIADGVITVKHDAVQFGVYKDEFAPDEEVIVTEKLHGSQLNYTYSRINGVVTETVASKGIMENGLSIKESDSNTYWQAVRNSKIHERVEDYIADIAKNSSVDVNVSVIGEVVPVQKGYSYGFDRPTMLVFSVWLQGVLGFTFMEDRKKECFGDVWVPVLFEGKLSDINPYELCKGKEQVSGRELHIREGIVISPKVMRRAADGTKLFLKVINPAYAKKDKGEDFS